MSPYWYVKSEDTQEEHSKKTITWIIFRLLHGKVEKKQHLQLTEILYSLGLFIWIETAVLGSM